MKARDSPISIFDREVWTAADLIVKRHGPAAVIEAARMIDRMLDHGDRDGQLVWKRIRRAVEALQAPTSGRQTRAKIHPVPPIRRVAGPSVAVCGHRQISGLHAMQI